MLSPSPSSQSGVANRGSYHQLSTDDMVLEVEPGDMDILRLLMPMFTCDKDGVGKEDVPPLPLSFDRVNRGQPPRSTAALLSLPYEILGLILVYVNSGSLPALALANHDCLQWARSRQFCSIKLDYSYASVNLVEHLLMEHRDRLNTGSMISPSIGDCIRRITVATKPIWVRHRLGADLGSERFEKLPEDERREQMVEASKEFLNGYISIIQAVLNIITMPHLELLDWEDNICLPHSFFKDIAMSSIKHLKLYRVQVKEEFVIELPKPCKDLRWPLQTLHMNIYPSSDKWGKISTSPLSTSILRLCAHTLRDLTLENMNRKDPLVFVDQNSIPVPRFPNLRNLALGSGVLIVDTSTLDSLVHDDLRTLDIDAGSDSVIHDFVRQRGRIPALETLTWEPADHPIDFLRANSHLTKLALPRPIPTTLLETKLLPLFSESFTKLKSLSLIWEDTSISEISLEMVASLRTLEHLHLSSGCQYGWIYDWLIDHQVMRKHLSKLSLLRRLAFSRDTYVSDKRWISRNQYYVDYLLPSEDMPQDPDYNNKEWEDQHKERILKEANHYVKEMANLEWLYFGQIPMQVAESQVTGCRIPEPLSPERDSRWTLLTTMFGGNVS